MIQINISNLKLSWPEHTTDALVQIPAMQRRRLSPIAKLALSAAMTSLKDTQADYIVWASQYGDEAKTIRILEDVLQQQTPSPMLFSTSVHNAIAGLYSIYSQDATTSTSLCCAWTEALLEAYAYLRLNPQAKVLLVYYDEPLPEIYTEYQHFQAFALSAVLSLPQPNLSVDLQQLAKLRASQVDAERYYYQEAQAFYAFWQQSAKTENQVWALC